MSRTLLFSLIVAVAVAPVRADVAIERLIEDAGLSEGPVASRDLPGWKPPQKLVVRDAGNLVESLQAEFPGVRFLSAAATTSSLQ